MIEIRILMVKNHHTPSSVGPLAATRTFLSIDSHLQIVDDKHYSRELN